MVSMTTGLLVGIRWSDGFGRRWVVPVLEGGSSKGPFSIANTVVLWAIPLSFSWVFSGVDSDIGLFTSWGVGGWSPINSPREGQIGHLVSLAEVLTTFDFISQCSSDDDLL